MVSMIKEINDNLKTIVDTLKDNLDNSINTLDNIQLQMDKKVEEAKKYKIQVDDAKEKIRNLEEDNKTLELSLKELNDKYGKMNLVSLIEAGTREIKAKMNDNLREISREKEHIADLTNKARTIKDLLMNLKKDKTVKEEKLENLKIVYKYYSERIDDIIDYAFNHSENLGDYRKVEFEDNNDHDQEVNYDNKELENTMVFDEIANIDENKNFKDEMSFINDQIDNEVTNNYANMVDEVNKSNVVESNDVSDNNLFKDLNKDENDKEEDSTGVFDSIISPELIKDEPKEDSEVTSEPVLDNSKDLLKNIEDLDTSVEENKKSEEVKETKDEVANEEDIKPLDLNQEEKQVDELSFDNEHNDRIEKIDNLFSSINDTETNKINLDDIKPINVNGIENSIDNAYKDVFGSSINEPLKKEPTLTDIFGNPIKSDDINASVKENKKLEDLFVENGIDFNKFTENEQSYLRNVYDEDKFNNIFSTLKRNNINLDNVYYAYNIFGDMTANELENLISKLINAGQSVEAIGLILEKLPKIKKYNLDEAIISYGDYVKDVDITDLVMKARLLHKNGGNV